MEINNNVKQSILLGYFIKGGNYSILSPRDLLTMIRELKEVYGLDEGVKLDYIEHKITSGIELDEDENMLLLSTISLYGQDKFFDENMELVRVQQ